jgi:hypothetical protein
MDKFPALAGIARRYHLATGDEYLAGLWKSTLITDLLWKRESHPGFHRTDTHYGTSASCRAPSWSWAAEDGKVSFLDEGSFYRFTWPEEFPTEVLGCNVKLVTPDEFGAVSGGELFIQGPTRSVSRVAVGDNGTQIMRARFDNDQEFNLGDVWLDEADGSKITTKKDMGLVCCLLLIVGYNHYGLLLLPARERHGCYTCIGIFHSTEAEQIQWFNRAPKKTITIL